MIAVYIITLSITVKKEEGVAHIAHLQHSNQVNAAVPEATESQAAKKAVPPTQWQLIAQSARNNVLALMIEEDPIPPRQEKIKDAPQPVRHAVAQAGQSLPAPQKPCPVACPRAMQQQATDNTHPLDITLNNLLKVTGDMQLLTQQLLDASQKLLPESKGFL